MKVYIERNNVQVDLIRFSKTNIDFIDVGNFEVGIYFRDRRVYETIRDVSPLFGAYSNMCLFDKRQFDPNHLLLFTPFLTV